MLWPFFIYASFCDLQIIPPEVANGHCIYPPSYLCSSRQLFEENEKYSGEDREYFAVSSYM